MKKNIPFALLVLLGGAATTTAQAQSAIVLNQS